MGEAFITRRGGGQKWGKYSSAKTGVYTHTSSNTSSQNGAYTSATQEITVGSGYTFDKYTGYKLTGETKKRISNTQGYYQLDGYKSGVYTQVNLIYGYFTNGGYVWLDIHIVGSCAISSYEYPKGDTKYCSVISNEGTTQPERGTVVAGSANSNSCAIEVDGTPYYYEKE